MKDTVNAAQIIIITVLTCCPFHESRAKYLSGRQTGRGPNNILLTSCPCTNISMEYLNGGLKCIIILYSLAVRTTYRSPSWICSGYTDYSSIYAYQLQALTNIPARWVTKSHVG